MSEGHNAAAGDDRTPTMRWASTHGRQVHPALRKAIEAALPLCEEKLYGLAIASAFDAGVAAAAKENAMNATDTEQETGTNAKPQIWECPVCGNGATLLNNGVILSRYVFAHNTCSQGCARTAAIVEAVDDLSEALAHAYAGRMPGMLTLDAGPQYNPDSADSA